MGLLPDWRHRGRAALSRLTLLWDKIFIRRERTNDGDAQAISQSSVHGSAE